MPTRGQPGRCKGGIGMKKIFVAAATVAIFALLVSSPAVAKGGKPGGGAVTAPSTIDLCTVDGVAVNSCATGLVSLASTPTPHLGGSVKFASSAQGLAGWEYPMVGVWCYQD